MKYLFIFLVLLLPFNSYSEGFQIAKLKSNLEKQVMEKINAKKVRISGINIKREGGGKIFTLQQAKDAKIADLLKISSLEITNDRFQSKVSEISGKYTLDVSGVVAKMMKIPVLAENIQKEAEITQDAIELIDIPEKNLRGTTIIGVKDLIGTVAARNLNKGVQISFADVKKPMLVKRNDMVQAIYQMKNMEIKTLAIAQQDGAVNQVITLKNFDSGKVFEAKVSEDGKVYVNYEEKEIVLK